MSKPDPEFVAAQLRKPSGEFAPKVAEAMDEGNTPLFELTVETMKLRGSETVLEIGFGSGRNFDRLFNRHDHLQVYGIDYSPEMVESARTRNADRVEGGQLQIKESSSDELPFPDGTFDKVYCNNVIYFWEDPKPHLNEIKRVLKPGGQFYTGMRTRESMQLLPFSQYDFKLYEISGWSEVLEEHGLQVTELRTSLDPPFELEEQTIRMESVCIAALLPNS